MNLMGFKDLKGLETVSTEAYKFGAISDMRYNPDSWKIKGFRINQSSRFKKTYPEYKSKVLISPSTKFVVGDVLLLNHDVASLKPKMVPDADEIDMVSKLYGKKVITSEGFLVGTVDSIHIDIDSWTMVTASVRLDKEAHAPLGVKRFMFNKVVSGVQMAFISKIGEDIKLKITKDDLKKHIMIEE